jgi:hypothetical protein
MTVELARNALLADWDPAASPRAKHARVQGYLRLAFALTQLWSSRPAHAPLRSSLARTQPGRSFPATADDRHRQLVHLVDQFYGFVGCERAWFVLFSRRQFERGRHRPVHGFAAIARDLGLSVQHTKRIQTKALTDIATGLDRMITLAGRCDSP